MSLCVTITYTDTPHVKMVAIEIENEVSVLYLVNLHYKLLQTPHRTEQASPSLSFNTNQSGPSNDRCCPEDVVNLKMKVQ